MEAVSEFFGGGGDGDDGGDDGEDGGSTINPLAVTAVGAVVGTGLAQGLEAEAEKIVEEENKDEPPVVLEYWREFEIIGSLACDDKGGVTWLYRIAQLAILMRVGSCALRPGSEIVAMQSVPNPAGLGLIGEPNDLQMISAGLFGLVFLVLLLPLSDIPKALRPETGMLSRLGLGTITVAAWDARLLNRVRKVGLGVGVVSILAGIINTVLTLFLYENYGWDVPYRIGMVGLSALQVFVIPCLVSGWWVGSLVAAALVRDHVADVAGAMNSGDPAGEEDQAWMENVHGPALALDKPLRQLSLGWSRGLGGLCAALWAVSLQSLTNALNRDRALAFVPVYGQSLHSQRVMNLFSFALYSLVPLLLLADIAATSGRCDRLMESMNDLGIRRAHMCSVRQMEVINLRLTFLQTRLKNMHRGQGLGVTVFGTVVDKAVLQRLGIQLFTGATFIVGWLLSFSQGAVPRGAHVNATELCSAVSDAEQVAIDALQGIAEAASNSSCTFRVEKVGV